MNVKDFENNPFALGAIGALITALKFSDDESWVSRLLNWLVGIAVAGMVTPALVEWLHVSSLAYQSGCAFVMGLLGMSLASAVIHVVRELPVVYILTSWFKRRD